MKLNNNEEQLLIAIKAEFPIICVVSHEEDRVEESIQRVVQAKNSASSAPPFYTWRWSLTEGMLCLDNSAAPKTLCPSPVDALKFVQKHDQAGVFIIRDAFQFLSQPGTYAIERTLRDMVTQLGTGDHSKVLVLLDSQLDLPPRLEKAATVIDWALPTKEELREKSLPLVAASSVFRSHSQEDLAPILDRGVNSAVGLTQAEVENVFAKSLVLAKTLDPRVIVDEKKAIVRKSGVLEFFHVGYDLSAVGGLAVLKTWLQARGKGFSQKAKDYGLPHPKGVLVVGIPGCMTGDTELVYKRGARVGGREITLRDLYYKFNGLPTSTRPWVDLTAPTFMHSLDPDGVVAYNRVVAVLESGVKQVLRIAFSDGTVLGLTPDHPVAIPGGAFIPASELCVDSKVLARGSMKPKGKGGRNLRARPPRVVVTNKYHPHGGRKKVNGHEYSRVAKARLVVEAHMNDVPYDEFVQCLKRNQERAEGFKYLDPEYDVHHLDEDTLNDDLSNLVVLHRKEHAREHGKNENFNVEYVKEVRVVSVEDGGEEMTYDVQMDMPGNNFCASGIIVHNTGKSLVSKAIGAEWGMPVLRLDMGSLFGSLLGQSEAQLRKAIKTAEAMAPCVLWCDEIEKSVGSGGASLDGGTTSRVFGALLSWLQEKTAPVFFVATANDVSAIPPEMLRKGRFDELFFVDLPGASARKEIFSIHIKKRKRDPGDYDLDLLTAATPEFSGAEIEEAVVSAMFVAFEEDREFTTNDILAAVKKTVTLADTSAERVAALRRWATTRAVCANERGTDADPAVVHQLLSGTTGSS